MKQLLLLIIAALFAPSLLLAQDNSTATLKIEGASGNLGKVQISTTSEITFADGNMVVTDGTDSQTFALADIAEMSFDFAMSSADDLTAELGSGLTITLHNNVLDVTSDLKTPITVDIYSASGQYFGRHTSTGTLSVDLSSLTKGIYVLKVNDKVVKFIR